MEKNVIETYNKLVTRIHAGEMLSIEERVWLSDHPIESVRYGTPWVLTDMIVLDPAREYTLVIQCLAAYPEHPIVPTLTIPFEKGGYIQLTGVVGAKTDTKGMKQSTKLSFRMLTGITATARCVSDTGLLMVSYQGWVPDSKPFPLWYETISCDRFAMKKTVLSENAIQYSCCGADGTEEAFGFIVNWYPA